MFKGIISFHLENLAIFLGWSVGDSFTELSFICVSTFSLISPLFMKNIPTGYSTLVDGSFHLVLEKCCATFFRQPWFLMRNPLSFISFSHLGKVPFPLRNFVFKIFSLALIINCSSMMHPDVDFLWVFPVSSLLSFLNCVCLCLLLDLRHFQPLFL